MTQCSTVSDIGLWSSGNTTLLNTQSKSSLWIFKEKGNVFYAVFKVRGGLTETIITSEKCYSIPSYKNINLVYHAQKEYASENWKVISGVYPAETFLIQHVCFLLWLSSAFSALSSAA